MASAPGRVNRVAVRNSRTSSHARALATSPRAVADNAARKLTWNTAARALPRAAASATWSPRCAARAAASSASRRARSAWGSAARRRRRECSAIDGLRATDRGGRGRRARDDQLALRVEQLLPQRLHRSPGRLRGHSRRRHRRPGHAEQKRDQESAAECRLGEHWRRQLRSRALCSAGWRPARSDRRSPRPATAPRCRACPRPARRTACPHAPGPAAARAKACSERSDSSVWRACWRSALATAGLTLS